MNERFPTSVAVFQELNSTHFYEHAKNSLTIHKETEFGQGQSEL